MFFHLLFALRTISRGFKFLKNTFTSFSVKQVSRTVQQPFILMHLFIANLQQNGYGIYAVHLLIGL